MNIPRTTSPVRSGLAVATVAALTLGMSACGSKTNDGSGSATTGASAPVVSAPPLPAEPTFVGTPAGAIVDVRLESCGTDAGEQTAKLAVTNSTKKARDYAIMVIWLKNGSGTPLGSGLVKAKALAPGKKTEFSVKAKVVAKADKCALNVRAGTLK